MLKQFHAILHTKRHNTMSLAYLNLPTWQYWIITREPALAGGYNQRELP
jgi:hypothetical protein